jgi:glycerol-3-phosphate acyltransferase PlsY
MEYFMVMAAGYLIGSVSFSIIVFRLLRKEDIRKYGSGNAGMTNVLRTAGKGPALLVLLGDALKGVASACLGLAVGGVTLGVLAGLAAMVGHTYPLYFGFKGGKGVATGFGMILTLAPDLTLVAIVVFCLTLLLSRYVSLSSLMAGVGVLIAMLVLEKPLPIKLMCVAAVVLVFYRHRENIIRLYHGTENKIGSKRA